MTYISNIASFNQTTAFGDAYDNKTGDGSTAITGGDDKLNKDEFVAYATSCGLTTDQATDLFDVFKGNDAYIDKTEFSKLKSQYESIDGSFGSSTLERVGSFVALLENKMLDRLDQTKGTSLSDTIALSSKLNMDSAAMTQFLKIFGVLSEKLESAAAPRA